MYRRGFTIVELVIVVTIMAILLVLGVVNLRSAQVSARDDERKTDIETIALHLENFYLVGTTDSVDVGRYPSMGLLAPINTVKSSFRDADMKSFTAPGATDYTVSFVSATNNTQTAAGVAPQPTINQYVYQSIDSTGALCAAGSTDCRKFNLYYRLEANNTVYMATSINQ